jgi:two-component system sensor histidine kinase DesK
MHEIRDVEHVSRQALKEVREAIRGYRARLSDELVRARRLLDAASVSVVIDCAIGTTELAGHDTLEEVLALTLREAVTNVVRHSRAQQVMIRVARNAAADAVRLEVVDDGVGDHAKWSAERTGLRGMRERVEAVHGRLAMNATPTGTSLIIDLPAQTRAAAPLAAAPLKMLRA